MHQKNIFYFCLPVLLMAFVGCSNKEAVENSTANLQPTPFTLSSSQKEFADIQTGQVEYRLISEVISCTGEIEVPPKGKASVSVPLGGFIKENFLVPGTSVKKGQVLARVTNPEYIILQQEYLETLSEFLLAEQTYKRQQLLQEQNATATKNLQQSESTYKILQGKFAALKAQLQLVGIGLRDLEDGNIQSTINIKAPISGYITDVNHAIGEFVEPREVIFEIVNMEELHFQLKVSEQDIARVNKGQHITLRPSGTQSTYNGTVALISPKRNPEDRTFSIHGHIHSVDDELKAGMFIGGDILISNDSLAAVPIQSVVYSDNKPFVITENNGAFALESVETGTKMEGWVEIRNPDVLQHKKIVAEGASRLFAAMKSQQ